MKKVPYTKDNLHSIIDYKKLIELQANECISKTKSTKEKVKTLTKPRTAYRGGRND